MGSSDHDSFVELPRPDCLIWNITSNFRSRICGVSVRDVVVLGDCMNTWKESKCMEGKRFFLNGDETPTYASSNVHIFYCIVWVVSRQKNTGKDNK